MRWRIEYLEIEPDDWMLVAVATNRHRFEFVGLLTFDGRRATLSSVHALGAGPNTMGNGALIALARDAMEFLDVDEIRIDGAARTSGAGPGRRPAPIVFRRQDRLGATPRGTDG